MARPAAVRPGSLFLRGGLAARLQFACQRPRLDSVRYYAETEALNTKACKDGDNGRSFSLRCALIFAKDTGRRSQRMRVKMGVGSTGDRAGTMLGSELGKLSCRVEGNDVYRGIEPPARAPGLSVVRSRR